MAKAKPDNSASNPASELFATIYDSKSPDEKATLNNLLSELAMRTGLIPESGDAENLRSRANQDVRKKSYKKIEPFLQNYRSLRRIYNAFHEEFIERVAADSQGSDSNTFRGDFDRLCDALELLSAREERKFQSIYAAQIVNGRRMEYAIDAFERALRMLRAKSEEEYIIIFETYVSGEHARRKKDIIASIIENGYEAPNAPEDVDDSYYYNHFSHLLSAAKNDIASLVFSCSSEQEFAAILYYNQSDLPI